MSTNLFEKDPKIFTILTVNKRAKSKPTKRITKFD